MAEQVRRGTLAEQRLLRHERADEAAADKLTGRASPVSAMTTRSTNEWAQTRP